MKNLLLLLFTTILIKTYANDSTEIRKTIDTLCSHEFLGRGYVNNGVNKAAEYIRNQMQINGAIVQSQPFTHSINTFPGIVFLKINDAELIPGKDYLIEASSKHLKAKGKFNQADSNIWINQKSQLQLEYVNKLTWSASQQQHGFTSIQLLKSANITPTKFEINVEADFINNFESKNIIGSIKGNVTPDSIIVFTAHYDHLGAMGSQVYFAGANDNASGTALLLQLIKYYKANPPAYTIVFIAFAGEEAGLIGSEYFVNHPTFNLKSVRFLLNLDLMGNGEEGITVVNATEFPIEFRTMQEINTNKKLLTAVNPRGKARNSDHYWFTEKGVPSFFIYTLGARKAYHDIDDVPETIPLMEIVDLQKLLITFVQKITKKI